MRSRVARILIVVAIAAVIGFLAAPQLGTVDNVNYYKPVDDRHFIVGVITGSGTWTRVTEINETTSSVVVTVRSLSFPFLPGSASGRYQEFTVSLVQPLGTRTVVDATGYEVPRKTD